MGYITPVTLVAVALMLLLGTESALAGCIPYRTNNGQTYFGGWVSPSEPNVVTVNSSNIYNYPNPYVYPGSGVFAWVMIVGPGSNNYAQIGWVVDANGRHTFTEWNANGHVGSNFTITADTPGLTSWYEVYLGSGTNYCFADNGFNVGCSGNLGWVGYYGEDLGEIHTL